MTLSISLSDEKVENLFNEIEEELPEDKAQRLQILRKAYDSKSRDLENTKTMLETLREKMRRDLQAWDEDELLEAVSDVVGERVLPASRFCRALWEWAEAIEDKFRRETGKEPTARAMLSSDNLRFHGATYAPFIRQAFIDIEKSGLLARLLYKGEDKREYQCPEHEGEMAMTQWINDPDAEPCPYGCDGTGWLHEDPEGEDE